MGLGMDLSGLEWGQLFGDCKYGKKLSGSIECGEFLA